MANKLRVGGRIFFDTATITKITENRLYYHCDICGQDKSIDTGMYEENKIKICVGCKYADTAIRNKCIKTMGANKARIVAELKKKQAEIDKEIYESTHKGKLEVVEDTDSEDYKVKCRDCGEVYLYRKFRFDELRNPMCLKCGKRGGYTNQEGKTFGKFNILRELGGGEVECKCETCGIEEVYNKAQVTKKLIKCKACKSKDSDDTESVNWAGSIVNNLYVVKEQINGTTDVKTYCLICGRLAKVPVGSLINGTAKCICENEDVMIKCRYCGKDTYKVDIQNKRLKCTNPYCSGISKFSNFDNECKVTLANGLYNITLQEEYNNRRVDRLNYDIKGDKYGNKSLVVFKKPVYLGRDRKRYYRCYCLAHKKYLLLSYNEIGDISVIDDINYEHDLCSSEFNMDINYIE